MTHDERIDAMAQAMMVGNWYVAPDFAREMFKGWARLTLDAAGVEEMVREAVRKTADAAFVALSETTTNRIVNEVMGK